MKNTQKTIAYIDGANLHNGVKTLDFDFDYSRFRIWLKDKFNVSEAYIFLGNIPKYSNLYAYLQECNYKIIFKEVVYDNTGKAKGNCDADLVLKMTQDFYNKKYEKALLVSGDGDYAPLIRFLNDEKVLLGIICPSKKEKCSILIKRINIKIFYIFDQISILKRKIPQ
jgi:uncharacterized LabA/DUF88 family protein